MTAGRAAAGFPYLDEGSVIPDSGLEGFGMLAGVDAVHADVPILTSSEHVFLRTVHFHVVQRGLSRRDLLSRKRTLEHSPMSSGHKRWKSIRSEKADRCMQSSRLTPFHLCSDNDYRTSKPSLSGMTQATHHDIKVKHD